MFQYKHNLEQLKTNFDYRHLILFRYYLHMVLILSIHFRILRNWKLYFSQYSLSFDLRRDMCRQTIKCIIKCSYFFQDRDYLTISYKNI